MEWGIHQGKQISSRPRCIPLIARQTQTRADSVARREGKRRGTTAAPPRCLQPAAASEGISRCGRGKRLSRLCLSLQPLHPGAAAPRVVLRLARACRPTPCSPPWKTSPQGLIQRATRPPGPCWSKPTRRCDLKTLLSGRIPQNTLLGNPSAHLTAQFQPCRSALGKEISGKFSLMSPNLPRGTEMLRDLHN